MLGSIYTELARNSWTIVPGRRVDFTVNANGQYEKETYIDENGNTAFAVNYTYNANGKVISISCTNS